MFLFGDFVGSVACWVFCLLGGFGVIFVCSFSSLFLFVLAGVFFVVGFF